MLTAQGGQPIKFKIGNCIQCGKCSGSCPAGIQLGSIPRRLVAQLGLGAQLLDREELWWCTTCYTCQERCPKGVRITDALLRLRNLASRLGNHPRAHLEALRNIYITGSGFPESPEIKSIRIMLGLVPSSDLSANPQQLRLFQQLLEETWLSQLAGRISG